MNQAFLKQHFCREKIYISGKMHLFISYLYFADPSQKLQGIQVLLFWWIWYNVMEPKKWLLWKIFEIFKAWNVQICNAWHVLHMTHTYLVEHYFAAGQPSLRTQTFWKYSKFVQKLLQFPSKEICFLSKVLLNDPRSTLCKNVWFLNDLTNVNHSLSFFKMGKVKEQVLQWFPRTKGVV